MFKKYLIAILSTSLLLGCDFRPSTKVIEYQEEVKLSDGSMIWVDIKRHYRLAGEPFQKKNYLPSIVEISWDTGFPNVGRQSAFFDNHIYLIDKYQDEWYIVGYPYPYEGNQQEQGVEAVNCRDVGTLFNQKYDCLVVMNKQGQFVKKSLANVQNIDFFKHNLIATDDDDWDKNIAPFLGKSKKISLSKKLDLKKMTAGYLSFNKPYIFKLEYSYE